MRSRVAPIAVSLLAILMISADAYAQGGRGPRGVGPGRGRGPDAEFQADREVFHSLLTNHAKIRREVRKLKDGVETVTESDDPEVAAFIRKHVAAMYRRVEDGRPIHRRDPLFAELFRHADKIKLKVEAIDDGIRVVETSDDPYVAALIQAHAEVVSRFVKHGASEVQKNHAVPKRASK